MQDLKENKEMKLHQETIRINYDNKHPTLKRIVNETSVRRLKFI